MRFLKKFLIGLTGLLIVGGVLFLNRGVDEQHEKEVTEKVVAHAEQKYGKENIISVKSAYDDKHRDKEKRYQIAVKVEGQGLKEGQYFLFRLKDRKVIPWGTTYTLPKESKK